MLFRSCCVSITLHNGEFYVTCHCKRAFNQPGNTVRLGEGLRSDWTNASLERALKDLDCKVGKPPYQADHNERNVWELRPSSKQYTQDRRGNFHEQPK